LTGSASIRPISLEDGKDSSRKNIGNMQDFLDDLTSLIRPRGCSLCETSCPAAPAGGRAETGALPLGVTTGILTELSISMFKRFF